MNISSSDIKYAWALVRGEFEKHRNVRDMRVAKMLLEEGEQKLFERWHPYQKYFLWSPGGLMFERDFNYPDAHMDFYHPLEKAEYPYYFANREKLKKEYIKMWEQKYKNDPPIPDH